MNAHGWNQEGDWYFALERAGRPLVEADDILPDCFPAAGFTEYPRATHDREAREIARATCRRIRGQKGCFDIPRALFTCIRFFAEHEAVIASGVHP